MSDPRLRQRRPLIDEQHGVPAGLAGLAGNTRTSGLLERVAARHLESARILWAHGKTSEARQAERFASRIALMLQEPRAVRQMHAFSERLSDCSHPWSVLEQALEGAMSLLGGDFGNIQIRNPANRTLTIAVESGFSREFLEYFAVVDDASTACGRAAEQRAQTVIFDVNVDSAFVEHRQIAAAAGFRAVQSTPLIDNRGCLRGVISTHFRRPHRPASSDLKIMQWYGELVANAVKPRAPAPTVSSHRTVRRAAGFGSQLAGY